MLLVDLKNFIILKKNNKDINYSIGSDFTRINMKLDDLFFFNTSFFLLLKIYNSSYSKKERLIISLLVSLVVSFSPEDGS